MAQRRQVYDDLYNALKVMNIITEQTPIPIVFYAMWLLENKQLRLGLNINVIFQYQFGMANQIVLLISLLSLHLYFGTQNRCNFAIITEALQETFDDKIDLYWIAKGFYKCTLGIASEFSQLKELSYKLLEKENPQIHK